MSTRINWHRDRAGINMSQKLEQYLRSDMDGKLVEAYDSAKTTEATEPTGMTGWIADPEVDGTYAFVINGDVAIVVYTQDSNGWGWDFECADWFELVRAGDYPWVRS